MTTTSSTASRRATAITAGFWAWPWRDAQGAIATWFGTCTDIHDQKMAAEQLANAYADLEAKVMFRNLEPEYQVQMLQQSGDK